MLAEKGIKNLLDLERLGRNKVVCLFVQFVFNVEVLIQCLGLFWVFLFR
jgi:hypothetical protein